MLLEALRAAIPSDMQMFLGVDPASLLFNRLLALQERNASGFWHWLEHIYLIKEPTFETSFAGLMRARLSAVVIQDRIETSWGMPPDLFYPLSASEVYHCYHEINSPAGGLLRIFFAVDGHYIAALEMSRLEARPAFQPTDLAFARLIAPLIGRALRSAFDRERANTSLDLTSSGMTGVLILSPTKTVMMATPAALAWMEHLRANEQIKGDQLPTAVVSALASLSPRVQELLPHTVQVLTPTGPLRIEASQTLEDGSLAVTLVPQQARIPLEVPASWPLTRQERLVCELLLRGQSNRQIAASLVVSEHTVESHCAHVYEKLGVQSRRELLVRFFQEARYPELGFHWKRQR
jgi:DNA-binding NarL/FixJ family response regulator